MAVVVPAEGGTAEAGRKVRHCCLRHRVRVRTEDEVGEGLHCGQRAVGVIVEHEGVGERDIVGKGKVFGPVRDRVLDNIGRA